MAVDTTSLGILQQCLWTLKIINSSYEVSIARYKPQGLSWTYAHADAYGSVYWQTVYKRKKKLTLWEQVDSSTAVKKFYQLGFIL